MMKKRMFIFSCLTLILAISLMAGCSTEVTFNGIKEEYCIKASDTTYDFMNGVTATGNGKSLGVKVDVSKVVFGTAGEYTVTYSAAKKTATSKVKIYGVPAFTSEDISIGYNGDFLQGIVCKDSFGNNLTITHTQPEKDAFDRILYKRHDITYTATDIVGNVATHTRKVTVTNEGAPSINDKTVDLLNPSCGWIVGAKNELNVVRLITGESAAVVPSENYSYTSTIGRFDFKPEYLATLNCNQAYKFDFTFSSGYKAVDVTVTDNQLPDYEAKFSINDKTFCVGAIELPTAEKGGNSLQKINVLYKLDDVAITDLKPQFTAGKHVFKIVYTRGDEEIANSAVTMNFTVLEAVDFYGRTVEGEEFLGLWKADVACNNRPESCNNRIEMSDVDGVTAFNMINELPASHGDDCRAFYLETNYLNGIRDAGYTHLAIKFKLKFVQGGDNNFFIDYYETDPAKFYNGKDRWRGGNGEFWGKSNEMNGDWKTIVIPMNKSDTTRLFMLKPEQGFYIASIIPTSRTAYVGEVANTDSFGMMAAIQCGGDDLPNLKLFYNATNNSSEAALKSKIISIGKGIDVSKCGNITPIFTSFKGMGSAIDGSTKTYNFPRLTDPTLGVHNKDSGKVYIRWQITNGTTTATMKMFYFFSQGNNGHGDHSGKYEEVLRIDGLPLLENGYAGLIVNDKKQSSDKLTEFITNNGADMVEKITSKGALIDFNTQCARGNEFFSIRFFYNAADKGLNAALNAPSVYFVEDKSKVLSVENVSSVPTFTDTYKWGSVNADTSKYNFPGFRDAHEKGMHDGGSGRVFVKMAIYNDAVTGKATLEIYYKNGSNKDLGQYNQLMVLKIENLDALADGYCGLLIDDSVFNFKWFEKNIIFTEGFKTSPYALSNVGEIKNNSVTMNFGAQCGQTPRNIKVFYNAATISLADVEKAENITFSGTSKEDSLVVVKNNTNAATFNDSLKWGKADSVANQYKLPNIQLAHTIAYHNPNSGVVDVKIEIINDQNSATMNLYFKNPADGAYDLALSIGSLDEVGAGFAGIVIDGKILNHDHIKNFKIA